MQNPVEILHELVDEPLETLMWQPKPTAVFGYRFPWELLHAAGRTPVKITAFAGNDKTFPELNACRTLAADLPEKLHSEGGLSGVCIGDSCFTIDMLRQSWQANDDFGGCCDLKLSNTTGNGETKKAFLDGFKSLRNDLSAAFGRITDSSLSETIALSNRCREQLQRLRTSILSGKSSYHFSDLIALEMGGGLMKRIDWADLMDLMLESPFEQVELGVPVDIYTVGWEFHNKSIIRFLEDLDLRVVGASLNRKTQEDLPLINEEGDPIIALAEAYAKLHEEDLVFQTDRTEAIVNEVKTSGAKGVLLSIIGIGEQNTAHFDDIRKALDAEGIPNELFAYDATSNRDPAEIGEFLRSFADSL